MIVIRDVFQVKFGRAQDAIQVVKEGIALFQKILGRDVQVRLLTDLAGANYYTLVLEFTHESISTWEQTMKPIMSNSDWKAWYQKVVPLMESGRREIFNVVM